MSRETSSVVEPNLDELTAESNAYQRAFVLTQARSMDEFLKLCGSVRQLERTVALLKDQVRELGGECE